MAPPVLMVNKTSRSGPGPKSKTYSNRAFCPLANVCWSILAETILKTFVENSYSFP